MQTRTTMALRPQHSRRASGAQRAPVAALAAATLVLTLSGLSSATAATVAPSATSATTTPGAPAMPDVLHPGAVTTALFPMRSVPAYAGAGHLDARVKPATSGAGTDTRFQVPTPVGSTLLWGDWNRDGAYTPAIYTAGHWTLYDAMLGQAPVPSGQFDFGGPGDKPVVGDFNGDGRTDIGVVRGNVWLLREYPAGGATTYQFTFGAVTDVPVVGDWDGNGKDGVGVRRGTHWFLLQEPRAPRKGAPPTFTFTFGRAVDWPVVGDWDGDGKDTVGAVRGSAWFLRDRLSRTPTAGMSTTVKKKEAKSTVTKSIVSAPAGAVPTPWRTPAGPNAAACATASSGVAQRAQLSAYVRPSLLLDKALPYDPANPALSTDPVFQLRTSLLDSERYLLGAQYIERWYTHHWENYTDILAKFPDTQQEYAVRRPAMAALTTAVASRTGAHNDASVGRTKDEAIRYTDWLVRSIACQHVSVSPGGWGAGWQTAHWANLTGEAAWLIWDRLTPQTREYVAQMLAFEADHQLTQPLGYWADANGAIADRGNTRAEDDAWNAAALELAVNMMPTHPHAANWRRKAVDLETASYSRFADVNSPTVINGVTLADRLDGSNIFDDGTVANHQVVQPDYMTNIQQNWWAADYAGLAGRQAPVAAFVNAPIVYGAFTTRVFTAGEASPVNGAPFDVPGGTIYQPGTNSVYFPQPTIWGAPRRAHFVSFDAHALAYGLDTNAAWPARDALAAHVAGQQALVAADGVGDGRTYSYDPPTANTQDRYNGREEYASSQLAEGWLALYVSRNAWDKVFNAPALDAKAYAPLPVLAPGAIGWSAVPRGTSATGQRLSP